MMISAPSHAQRLMLVDAIRAGARPGEVVVIATSRRADVSGAWHPAERGVGA